MHAGSLPAQQSTLKHPMGMNKNVAKITWRPKYEHVLDPLELKNEMKLNVSSSQQPADAVWLLYIMFPLSNAYVAC